MPGAVDGVHAGAVARGRLFQVFVGDGLDGGDAAQHLVVLPAHFHYIIERTGLDVQLLGQHVQLLRGAYHQFGVGQVHQVLVAVGASVACLPDGRGDGVGLEDDAVEVVVTLLDILQDAHRLVHAPRQHIVLSLQAAVLLAQLFLRGRAEEDERGDEARRTQSHADEQASQMAHQSLAHGGVNAVVGLCTRVVDVVNFAHDGELFGCQCGKSNKNKLSLRSF